MENKLFLFDGITYIIKNKGLKSMIEIREYILQMFATYQEFPN